MGTLKLELENIFITWEGIHIIFVQIPKFLYKYFPGKTLSNFFPLQYFCLCCWFLAALGVDPQSTLGDIGPEIAKKEAEKNKIVQLRGTGIHVLSPIIYDMYPPSPGILGWIYRGVLLVCIPLFLQRQGACVCVLTCFFFFFKRVNQCYCVLILVMLCYQRSPLPDKCKFLELPRQK